MSYFLLVVTFGLTCGSERGVSVERFNSHIECYKAMVAVTKEAPHSTAICKEVMIEDEDTGGGDNE